VVRPPPSDRGGRRESRGRVRERRTERKEGGKRGEGETAGEKGARGMRIGDVGVEHDCTGVSERASERARERERERERERAGGWLSMVADGIHQGPGRGCGRRGFKWKLRPIRRNRRHDYRAPASTGLQHAEISACRSRRAGERARTRASVKCRSPPTRAHSAHTLASPSFHLILARARARARGRTLFPLSASRCSRPTTGALEFLV